MSKIQSVSVTADAQCVVGKCYFVGICLYDQTGDGHCVLYNESTATKTASQMLAVVGASDEMQSDSVMLPLPGVECVGIYADWTAGNCVVYYYR